MTRLWIALCAILAALCVACASVTPTLAPEPTASPRAATRAPLTATAPRPTLTLAPTLASAPTLAPSRLLANGKNENGAYLGIGRLNGENVCTATFIKTSDNRAAPAYALTSGRCVNALEPNQIVLNQPAQNLSVVFNYFFDTREKQTAVRVRAIAFATAKGTDLAVLELEATVGDLVAKNIQPLALANGKSQPGERVNVIGAPFAGWEEKDAFLRLAACALDAPTPVIEQPWFWHELDRNHCADIRGGSAGAPVLSARNEIVGVIATTTAGSAGTGDCVPGRPCEVSGSTATVRANTNYAAGVIGLAQCFAATGKFEVTRAGCVLDAGKQIALEGTRTATRPFVEGTTRATWNITVMGDPRTYYRYKLGAAGSVNCRTLDGYGKVIGVAESDLINDPVAEADGFYLACILAGTTPQYDPKTWQDAPFATLALLRVDTTPPKLEPRVVVQNTGAGFDLAFEFAPPELVNYKYKLGKAEATDCAKPEGYTFYRRMALRVAATETPAKLCVIGYDDADNATPPRELTIK